MVGFEGARDEIVVVAKKMSVFWLTLSPEVYVVVMGAYRTFMLTPLFFVGGILSMMGLVIALAHDIDDKRWYWLFVGAGAWLPLVSMFLSPCTDSSVVYQTDSSQPRPTYPVPHSQFTIPTRTCWVRATQSCYENC